MYIYINYELYKLTMIYVHKYIPGLFFEQKNVFHYLLKIFVSYFYNHNKNLYN